ncbi:protein phosphatase 2C domain-containing protein [Novosphingobium sp. G106]|uniref:PP2C family protein-serine/threonine phosphatase n=1 Tax=Novosphingobium sp. G106 TaxID=2849500 RepID=UPI001C2DCD8D|nr:protein phosphatase 2C domain-containing protein [Novosphingobium sp. G106]MBV1686405.1 protein phosphatase 2C domain-containing protein [Novosphingobium sp. G106]
MGISAAFSQCGPVRHLNADALLADDAHHFYAIADGIGSRPTSAEASRLAVIEAHQAFLDLRSEFPACGVAALIDRAARRFREHFASEARVPGTTLTVMIIAENALHYASVGDSPVFLLRDGVASLLTKHHTAVDQNQVINDFTALKSQSGSNVLVNTVGRFPPRPISYPPLPIVDRCRALLCTDGLFEIVTQAELGAIDRPAGEMAAVLQARGQRCRVPDNYSVIIVDLEPEEDGHAERF